MMLAVFFFFAVASVSAWEWNTDVFGVKMTTGNVPKYDFWLKSNTSVVYSVFFSQFFEATVQGDGLKKYGPSSMALPSLTWEWTDPVTDDNGDIHFNITARDGAHGGNTPQFSALTFANHLFSNTTQTSDNSTILTPALKFDVIINDYAWVSAEADAKIVLFFDFKTAGQQLHAEGNKILLGDCFFSAVDSASAYNDSSSSVDVPVTLQLGDAGQGQGIWIVYDHFNAVHLVHDPQFGTTSIPADGPNLVAIIVPIVVVVALIAVALFFFYRQRLNYESL
eukprot:TRINITY_DN3383_c0_g1_i1.p1 TRINITY_DN3383_c0_g1~~TRINITY_DN3383_c0_g1_i1.p1  ORF type:complete len:280 (-),score=70.03 TRINITY_DN3383_c0_g1_i1:109-948(-)